LSSSLPARLLAALVLGVLLGSGAAAQVPLPSDTLAATADSVRIPADSSKIRRDTTAVTGVDTVITYSAADSIVYAIPRRTMSLYKKGDLKFRDMALTAERIQVNWNTSTLNAMGIPDTSDSTGKKYAGTPVMKDGGEEYHGFELGYNFKTKRGKINVGDTQVDQGYYHGEDIKKIDTDIMFVKDGRYTTCDAPEPHYYFGSPKMKVMFQDKVIAEPVYLYIADVPIFALPFGVFPNKRGRRSGIIAPAYGDDGRRGKFLSHLGYYAALSDYMDLSLRSDLYSKGGWAAYADYRYSLRYVFTGSLSGEYKKLHTGESADPGRTEENSYRVNLTHGQTLDPTSRLNVNFTFTSNNSYIVTRDLRQALDQAITSNATLSKSWEGTPNSMSLNVGRRQNLRDGRIDETLPSISFNHSQSSPFRRSSGASGTEALAWYEQISLSYGANFTNNRSRYTRNVDSVKLESSGVTTLGQSAEIERDRNQTLSQNVSLNIAPKLGPVTVSPSLSYRDDRVFTQNDVPVRNAADSTAVVSQVRRTTRTGVLTSSVTASTKFYGIVQPGLLGIGALRHTVTPNLSFSYAKQIVGEDRAGRQMVLSLNVGNQFDMKTTATEEDKEPTKIQLLNVGVGTSYNFSADSLNVAPIGLSYRTGLGSILDVGGGASFDLYKLEQTGPASFRRVNKFLLSEEGRLARLTTFSISLSTTLAGEQNKKKRSPTADTTEGGGLPQHQFYGAFAQEDPDFSIPWRLSLSLDYSENKVQPSTYRSSSVRGNLEFNLTENWKFMMSGGYDLMNKEVVVPSVNISRDLHCWIMNFSWVPTGQYRQYKFEIRVKAPQLQDVKVTKQGSSQGIY
jgi:lipopolysaccharide assembly outer membrane protein LptD (OstA)